MSRDSKGVQGSRIWTAFDAFIAVQNAAAKIPQQPPPVEFWRAIFIDEDTDYDIPREERPKPADVSPRPPGFKDRPIGIDNKRYLCSIKVSKETETENQSRWRELVLANGKGNYNFYDTIDATGEKPVSLFNWWKVIFICGEDLEAMRLGIGDPLTDERLEELELRVDADVERGDARSVELVATEYCRRGRYPEAIRAADYGGKASDFDPGIWETYLEEKAPDRNVQRRLLELRNRANRRMLPHGYDGTLYSMVDCGEAAPSRECLKCKKKGALGSDVTFAAIPLCYSCRRLPRSEWPEPKPIPSFFTNFKSAGDGK